MWGTIATRLAAWLMRHARLTNENRQLLTASMLDRLGAVPLRARITIDETGRCFVDGKPLNLETAKRMREGARSLKHNFARKFVGEQVTWMAVHMGIHENLTPEQGLFAKAALWVRAEEDKLYDALGQFEGEEEQ